MPDANYRAPDADLSKDLELAREIARRLQSAHSEIDGLIRALEGRYIAPGPGPDPLHNPDSVPGGRNLYALNPEEVPTKPAWDLAVRLVNEMLAKKTPKKVGFDMIVIKSDVMKDSGSPFKLKRTCP